MRLTRQMKWTATLVLCGLCAAAVTGCHAEASLGTPVEAPPPPPPPPPPPDQDGDGILDADDKCPAEKEDGKPPDPNDGCPNLDEDGDNIPVPQDKCPTEPETVNGFEDDDGCPDTKPLVQVVGSKVQINQKIMFDKGKATITADSMKVVEAVAAVLKEHPEIELVAVGGHASKEGSEWTNRTLSDQRVKQVRKELIKLGVEDARLIATGYGSYCLIDMGETEEAHEKNRRVEFQIVYRNGKQTEEKLGCEAAEKKNIKVKLPAESPWKATPATPAKKEAGKPATPATPATPAKKPEAKTVTAPAKAP